MEEDLVDCHWDGRNVGEPVGIVSALCGWQQLIDRFCWALTIQGNAGMWSIDPPGADEGDARKS